MQLVAQLLGVVLIEEICFFYSHWALHQGPLYKRIHKQHHEWSSPMAWEAIYAHPIEHIFSNIIPVYLGPLIVKMHPMTFCVWVALATYSTLASHSGLHLPFVMGSPEEHDHHHATFTENFGVIGLLDTLHGTNKRFIQSEKYKNAHMLTSLEPLVHKTYLAEIRKLASTKQA